MRQQIIEYLTINREHFIELIGGNTLEDTSNVLKIDMLDNISNIKYKIIDETTRQLGCSTEDVLFVLEDINLRSFLSNV